MRKIFVLLMVVLVILPTTFSVNAQQISSTDSLVKDLDELITTAAPTERKLSNVAVPVTIINQKAIQQAGSFRLNNILQEQAGLYITNSFGNGVQIQGLSPHNVLIMIDEEPLTGRNAGVLDLIKMHPQLLPQRMYQGIILSALFTSRMVLKHSDA